VNDEWDKLERQLERATAPDGPTAGSLDAETASLREGWLALGELLRAVEPAVEPPLRLPKPNRPVRRTGRKAAGIAVLAASLLVGLTLAGRWLGADRPRGVASRPHTWLSQTAPPNADAERRITDAGPLDPDSEPLNTDADQVDPASLDDWGEWDDPLDQQIASVAQEVVRIQQDWDRVDEAFGLLYVGMEEMAEELERSPL